MDDDGDAFPVLGHAAFCRNVNAQVASNGLAHWVVLYFSNLLWKVAVNALNLVSCKLNIHVCVCACTYMRTHPELTWVLKEVGTTFS